MNDVTRHKAALRIALRQEMARLSPADREAAAARVVDRISRHERWRRARTVMLFIPLADEVNILPLVDEALGHRKIVLVPRYEPGIHSYLPARVTNLATDLVPGPFGVSEPGPDCQVQPLKPLDVTLVPGLGFDHVGHRLGRGKGHYDRLLAGASGEFWGIGFDCQLVTELPGEPHDVVLNCVITPAHWMEVVSARR